MGIAAGALTDRASEPGVVEMLIRWRTILVALIVATVYVAPGPTASLAGTRQAARSVPAGGLVFGIYPGGDAGELESPAPVDPELALQRIKALQGDRPFTVHLYTAWRDDDPSRLDAEIRRYTQAGLLVALTLRYLPPEGREGDAEGFAAYVRGVVGRYGVNAAVFRYVVGNEGNVYENPGASDGPFAGVREAIVRGT